MYRVVYIGAMLERLSQEAYFLCVDLDGLFFPVPSTGVVCLVTATQNFVLVELKAM